MKQMCRYLAFAAILFGTATSAQSVAQGPSSQQNESMAPLARVISLNLKGVPVDQALTTIGKTAGVKLEYSSALLPDNVHITIHAQSITVADALKKALSGTAFVYKQGVGGKISIVQGQQSAKAQGVITGKVIDAKSGKGISGATVSVGTDMRGVSTDEGGMYRLIGVSYGTQTVTVRLVGYAKQTRSIMVGDGATVTVDFRLEPSASVLNEVVVTGTIVRTELKAVPNAITVITAKQIEERGITRIDQLFRGDVPGLFSLNLGSSALVDEVTMFSRGATRISTANGDAGGITTPIKTYVDGVELADAKYLSQIDPKSIERIEILAGPQASTIYGAGAINGVMQIFTKKGNTIRPKLSLSLYESVAQNNLNSALAPSHQYDGNISGVEGSLSYNIGGGWAYTGAWSSGRSSQRTSVYGGLHYQSSRLTADVTGRRGETRNKQLASTTQVLTALAEAGKFSYTASSGGLASPTNNVLYGRTLGITLNYTPLPWWSHQITTGSDFSASAGFGTIPAFTAVFDTSVFNFQTPNYRTSLTYSSNLQFPITPMARATLTYGADHWHLRTSTLGWRVQSAGDVAASTVLFPMPGSNGGVYVQGQLGLWDELFLTYGIRQDWNPNYGEKARVRPGRFGMSYSRDVGIVSVKLRGSYGRSIKPPASNQINGSLVTDPAFMDAYGIPLYGTLPTPELGPEFQQGGEGGVELYFGNRGSLVVTRYNQTVDGLVNNVNKADSVRTREPGFITGICAATNIKPDGYCYFVQNQNLNVGSIRNQGWEVQGSVNLGPLALGGAYSSSTSRVIGVTPKYRALLTNQAFTPGLSFPYVPDHMGAVNISYSRRGTSMSLNVNGLGSTLRTALTNDLNLVTGTSLRLRTTDAHRIGAPTNYVSPVAGYVTANLNVTQKFASKIDGVLQIANLTNFYKNDLSYQYPTIGRQTKLGLRIRLQ